MTGRILSRCEVCSLVGHELANEMFARVPDGIDIDHAPDVAVVESVVADREKCEQCQYKPVA